LGANRRAVVVALALVGALAAACRAHKNTPAADQDGGNAAVSAPDRLAPLHAFEEERRRAADFAHLPPSDRALGPDPIAIRALPGTSPPRYVGLLRGQSTLVLLSETLQEIARAGTPALPTGLAVADDGAIAVSGEQAPFVALYAVSHGELHETERRKLDPDVLGLRDVALGGSGRAKSVIYTVDERSGALFANDGRRTQRIKACVGPFRLARTGDELVVDCLLDHQLLVFDLDRDGFPGSAPRASIHHDGPIWGFDARVAGGDLLIAAGGVEDHALDRTEGSFGFIDSFVFLYRVSRAGPTRLGAVNVSEHGVVTPKALELHVDASGGATVLAAGYGSDRLAQITWPALPGAPRSSAGLAGDALPTVTTRASLPGAASMASVGDALGSQALHEATLVFADPLLDAWVRLPPAPAAPAPVLVPDAAPAPARSGLSRVGEALFFTNLMAPWNHSDGRLSRFTCETCHFEGYIAGRTHHTGRGDVRATTKPLLGIFNNRPHFSRALDPNLTIMVDNEFRAAGAKSDHDPWFSASETGLPWLGLLGVPLADLDPVGMRRALMAFFMDFTHRPNTAVLPQALRGASLDSPRPFTETEKRGADVFAQRCESCHEARLSTDDPSTRQPRERWEALVMTREGPIVWASNVYKKTGVTPYVHDLGARPFSLRRLYKKWPYFTNGSAKTLGAVLERARFKDADFWHDAAPPDATALTPPEQEALRSFLELL
jgi:hypothetical protein